MGVSRTDIFTESQNEMATLAKVLGHPARIAILEHLANTPGCICGDIVDVIGLAQPTISQHLKELKRAGLIRGQVEGTSICYCLDNTEWTNISRKFSQFINQLMNGPGCC